MSNATNEELLRRDPAATSQTGGHGADRAKQRSHQEAEASKQQASEAADSLKSQASELKHSVSEEAGKAADEARRSAIEAGERLRSEGVAMVDRQKKAAAEELVHLRDALNAASQKLDEADDHRIADMTHVAADRLDAAASYLRDRDFNRLASDASAMARRRPELFYGGLFAVGLAASRFFKASNRRSH